MNNMNRRNRTDRTDRYDQNDRYYRNDRNDRNDRNKSRIKNIRNDAMTNVEEIKLKFDYANTAEELLDKDDIRCSEDVIKDACESFDDMGGEDGLKDDLLSGVYAAGLETPSIIQQRVIPQMLKGREILAQSQSGTGKTGAFTIAALELIDENLNIPQAIILSPTCELAQQTLLVGQTIASKMSKVNFSYTVGGTDRAVNIKELGGIYQGNVDEKVSQIVIATPGRLIDLLSDYKDLFSNIKLLIVDECDELLSESFRDEIKRIIENLPEMLQICLFSATLTEDVVKLSNQILNNPIQILIKKEKITLEGIKQTYIDINRPEDKLNVLIDMLATLPIQQFLVYVNSKKTAELVQNFLENENYSVVVINSSMKKYERANVLREFRKGKIKCLISTDLLSRGIDIQQLSLVINYELPREDNIQCYIHRIGRTGRYGRIGLSINLVTKYEKDIQNKISAIFRCSIEPLKKDFINNI